MGKKRNELITSLGSNENKLLVQKSLPLFALWRSNLTLSEFKILDTYLSRINSHNPEQRTVIFAKGELEQILGIKRIRTEELDERLKHLGTPIRIDDSTSKNKKFSRISLFEKAVAEQDENGLWQVEMTCTQSAMNYIFNIENLGYLRYKLRCITSITSRYSYILFCYLEHNRYRKTWEVELSELKQLLGCDKEETYKEYKRFNDRLLKRVHKELQDKTECKFDYEPIKKVRSVVAIRFNVHTLAHLDAVEPNKQLSLLPSINEPVEEINYGGELADLLGGCACDDEFTVEQVRVIQDLVLQAVGRYADNIKYCDYLTQQVHKMNLYDSKKKIKDRFSYLRKMIEKDI